jgi:tight adherence protein B
MSELTIVIALVFVAATFATYVVYRVFLSNRRKQQILNRRLERSESLPNPSIALATLRQERGFSNVSNPILRQLSDWLTQSGTRVQQKTFALAFLIIYLVLALVISVGIGVGLTSLGLALIAAVATVVLILIRQRRRRIFAFGEQLPDAIDIIMRGVRAGLPFSSAITLVAREMPDPVGTEFGLLADEIAFGLDVRSALENLHRRVGQEDLLFLTVAVSIQTQTGGNLGEILSRLSKLMRDRAHMRLKINALSAEGRLSAIALTILPFALFLVINFLSPRYYGAIRGHPLVEPAIYVGLLMLLVGNIIMYRMVHFKY